MRPLARTYLASCLFVQTAALGEPISLEVGQKHLFLDDFLIESVEGLKRTIRQPVDHPANPVILPEHPWEHRRIPFGSVYYSTEEDKFLCWYLAMNIYDSRPGFRGYRKEHHVPIHEAASLCYAESTNGVDWVKPHLGLHEFRGSKKNNIILTCPGTHFDSTSVIHTPHDAERPWKMISFIGLWPYQPELIRKQWGDHEFGIERHGHYAWSSKDGIHWNPMNEGEPVLRANDRSMFWWDFAAREYAGSAKVSARGKRAQKVVRSPNGVDWSFTPQWIHRADEKDHPGDEAEAAYGFNYGAQQVGFAELRRIRKGQSTRINWELLVSHDGRQWNRPIRELFLSEGPAESWRFEVFKIFASPPIERDGELLIYYGGKTGLNHAYTGTGPNQAVCLAKLRVDGFVSLDATEQKGILNTKPVLLTGSDLFLNLRASPKGSALIEILSTMGKRLALSKIITGDQVRQQVRWEPGTSFALPVDGVVKLRIHLDQAALYSIWME